MTTSFTLPSLLNHIILILALHPFIQAQINTYSSYFADQATAFDIDYDTNTIVFATDAFQIKIADTLTRTVSSTIASPHRAIINTISISDDATMVLTGGKDYIAAVIDVTVPSLVCGWDQIRGQIISSTFFQDNQRIAFATMQGYLYHSSITDCIGYRIDLGDVRPVSLTSISADNTIWIAGYDNKVYTYDVSTNLLTTKSTLPTSRTQSVIHLKGTSYIGVCTQRAFYLLNSANGAVQHTRNTPTMFTKSCRIMPSSTANQFYITAIPEQQFNLEQTNLPIWSIWLLDVSGSISTSLTHEQMNSGNQYGTGASSMIQLYDAATVSVSSQQIYVSSIGPGKDPYLNQYGTNSPCSNGYFSNGGTCQKCNWDLTVRYNCNTCSGSGICNSCLSFSYLLNSGGTKTCPACPDNCYTCSDASNCDSCVGGYTLVGSSCIISNNTGCLATDFSNGLTRCYQCEIGYYVSPNVTCIHCDVAYPGCLQCDIDRCYRCDAGYLINDTASGNCEQCSHWLQGCASCLNATYCDACYDQFPYFDTISANERTCKPQCYYTCQTCNHYQYDQCASCDANRTQVGVTCVCKPQYPFEDPNDNNKCTACEDFISDCITCSTVSFCDVCDEVNGYYINDINATHQECQLCNYTCGSCTSGDTWYNCNDCDPADFRVLDSSIGHNMCVCQSISYFEIDGQAMCEFCQDHISNCDVCLNSTYCVSCYSGYYLDSSGAGVQICSACSLPCSQCFGGSTNCTDCASGRQLDPVANTCDCLYGYYPTGTVSCAPCSSVLGSCQQCNNDTVCITCWPGTYFLMDAGAKKCDMCQSTCLTCDTWTHVCDTCDALANRQLNPSNDQCECSTGFTQTQGRCLNCGATFDFCTSCNLTSCLTCEPGYSLAYGGLKCIDCQTTYPGCILCLDGKCAECNTTLGYELSYSKCICQPGYYRKEIDCLPYKMGAKIQRLFPVYQQYGQIYGEDQIQIKLYFGCEKLLIPYGLDNSFTITVDGQDTLPSSISQDNTTIMIRVATYKDISRALVEVKIINKTIFDMDEYGPDQLVFKFHKNIYFNSTYNLVSSFEDGYQSFILPAVRILATAFLLLGGADVVILLVMTLHILPAFLLLNLTIPPPLQQLLSVMMKINEASLFVFADIKTGVQNYQIAYQNKYAKTYGLHGSILDIKAMDLVTALSILAFYFILGPVLLKYIPEGKARGWWQQKFIKKRYATSANIVICFTPSLMLSAAVNFNMQTLSTSVSYSVGISAAIMAITCIFVFVHGLVLLNTQFSEQHKTEQCYLGSSSLQPKSILYVLSILVIASWTIPILFFLHPVGATVITICLLLWHIKYFRNWDSFPSKIYFFVRLFYTVCMIIIASSFLIFSVSQLFQTAIAVSTLQLIGLCNLVIVIILIVLSFLQVLFLFLLSFYRLCKGSSNMVENIATEHSDSQDYGINEDTTSLKDVQKYASNVRNASPAPQIQELDQSYYRGTNKQEHMKKFKNNHFKTINYGFGGSGMAKSVRDLKNSTYNTHMGGTASRYNKY